MGKKKLPWVYQKCTVLSVRDGDTFNCTVDIGFGLRMDIAVRLKDINCEEMKGAKADLAEKAKQFTEDALQHGHPCTIVSYGWDKYGGRVEAEVILSDGRTLNDELVKAGLARKVK